MSKSGISVPLNLLDVNHADAIGISLL